MHALFAFALRPVFHSDDRGNFDPVWIAFMAVVILAALMVIVYLVYMLEIIRGPGSRGEPQ